MRDLRLPKLPTSGQKAHWAHLPGASLSLILSKLITDHSQPVLIIAENSMIAARLENELSFLGSPLIAFPDRETLPYDRFSPHQDIISARLASLYKMPNLTKGAILTTINTIMHHLSPPSFLNARTFLLSKGDMIDSAVMRERLIKAGYYLVNQVREHGEFAVRGSIIDLFPMGSYLPYRIDLFDNEVDSIRTFSPDTQRTIDTVDTIQLLPAKEFPMDENAIEYFRQSWRGYFNSGNPLQSPLYQDISEGISPPGIEYYLPLFFEETTSIFAYLSQKTLIVAVGDIEQQANHFWQEILQRYEDRRHDISHPLLVPEKVFIHATEITKQLARHALIHTAIQDEATSKTPNTYHFPIQAIEPLLIEHNISKVNPVLQSFITQYPGRILLSTESTGRREILLQTLQQVSLYPHLYSSWEEFLADDRPLGIIVAPLEDGFQLMETRIAVITEAELFGKRVKQPRERKSTTQDTIAIIRNLTELQIGDPVVHIDHGVGRYQGLHTLTFGDQIGEFLCLEYTKEDKLYVPISSLELISRYTGADPEHAPLHNLSTDQWQKAKRKAEEKVRDVAAELLDIYAKRAAREGFAFHKPDEQYQKFAAAFPFEETPDQERAIEQVIQDMTSTKPMDRVICGDVGFGKTEVAMRAAFLAVQNNKQVAILVPTTLLAQQHFQTFKDRFADWPIEIGVLSRFRTSKEQQAALQRLQEGKIDIMIGTHKLIQDDVKFKALGLIIIDEEHLFGVHQKEKLKSLRAHVDILTLTATPIPRTLNMSLSGIRDLSIIATPPARRLSVKTFVHEHEKHIVQEAVQREILRGGQVFFVHNDVATITKKAQELSTLVPEARIAIAHGQMRERELEQIMSDFYHRKCNLLVCTTIIESGIDIPTANTIIINKADRFGLAQLHQLRGRVGRSHHQAYAYLLISSRKLITPDAVKRLDAIASLEELGIGFTLATHDLEIRGAGELLGDEQSGNMHEVGFNLYTELLARAVEALRSGKELDWDQPITNTIEIDLQITALIPDHYLSDVTLRLQFYKRLANAKTTAELDELQIEMIDRFGLLPPALKNLFNLSELKLKLLKLGIKKLEANAKNGKIEFTEKPIIDTQHLINLIQTQPQRFKLEGATKLKFGLKEHEEKDRIQVVNEVIEEVIGKAKLN